MSNHKADREALKELILEYERVMDESNEVSTRTSGYQTEVKEFVQSRPVNVTGISILDYVATAAVINSIKTYWERMVEADKFAETGYSDAQSGLNDLKSSIDQFYQAIGKNGGNVHNLKASDIKGLVFQDEGFMEELLSKFSSRDGLSYGLSYSEREILYLYFQEEMITEQTHEDMNSIAHMMEHDPDGLKDRVNHEVLESEATLYNEIAIVEAYLFLGNSRPENHYINELKATKLSAYLSTLKSYSAAILEVREEIKWEHDYNTPLYARAEYLDFEPKENPTYLHIKSEIMIDINQKQDEDYTREDFVDSDNPIMGAVRINESEVISYYDMGASEDMSYKELLDTKEEYASFDSNYIGEQAMTLLLQKASGRVAPLISIGNTFGTGMKEKEELKEQIEIDEAQHVASNLNMEIQLSERFVPGSSEQLSIQLRPTSSTYNIMDRWEEMNNKGADILYPESLIANQDWEGIVNFKDENSFKGDVYNYIFYNELPEDTEPDDLTN